MKLLSRQKERALQLAQEALRGYAPKSQMDCNSLLSSLCRLCDELGSEEALTWADEQWQLFKQLGFDRNIVAYCTRLQLLERHGRRDEVDQVLCSELVGQDLSPNTVVLGSLMNAAAGNQDSKGAEELWAYLVQERHVEPSEPAYAAFAKSYLLSRRPAQTACVIESMLGKGFGSQNYKVAVDYLQSLVIVCHASSTPANLSKLKSALHANADLMTGKSAGKVPKSAKIWWQKLSR